MTFSELWDECNAMADRILAREQEQKRQIQAIKEMAEQMRRSGYYIEQPQPGEVLR